MDTSARPQWDDWESLRIIQVVQNALVQLGAGGARGAADPAIRGLPAVTPPPAAEAWGPRQLLAQAWQVQDMRTWTFEPPSCTTQSGHLLFDPKHIPCILSTICFQHCREPDQNLRMVLDQDPAGGQPEIIVVGSVPLKMDWLWSGLQPRLC